MNTQNNPMNPDENGDALEKFGIDITRLAHDGKIDPVIGRENEIRRIIQILSRRNKNNPVLIGEPGTGKTTVIEGLAKRIVDGDVPENLKGKKLITMDLSAMVAGAMYRGQFEERLKKFIKQVLDSQGEIIVFIDELHTIVGAGAMEGQMDVSNMMKPELARGQMKIVGATTLTEYQKYIEKDAALERRFQQVYIAEPSVEDTITILRGIKDKYEIHHGLHIKDSALISAATLSSRFISDRFLPDKAIDLMDEAAAKIRMEINSSPFELDNARRKTIQLEVEIEALKKEKDKISRMRLKEVQEEIQLEKQKLAELHDKWTAEKDIISEITFMKEKIDQSKFTAEKAQREGDFQKAAKILYDDIPKMEKEMQNKELEAEKNEFVKLEVDTKDIADIVSKWTGIPVQKMMEGEKEKLLHLEERLSENVIGQMEAVSKVSDVIRMSKIGVSDQDRPLGSFLFMGNTGVGKTELAKTISNVLFDDSKGLVRLDMSEFMESHSISKLIGSPPGYVGYDDGGQLTEKIRRRPYSVILFDEIEKAHPMVLNTLLQIMDDGRLTDSKGRTVNFKNTIIIMTSNLTEPELNHFLRPEFINRIDEILHFRNLSVEIIRKISDLRISELVRQMSTKNIRISVTEEVKSLVAEQGFDPDFGARPINRYIKRNILSGLSRYLLEHPDVSDIQISCQNGKINFHHMTVHDMAV